MVSSSRRRRLFAGTALLLCLSASGCGARMYPVTGTITLADGSPLTKGLVVFETTGARPVMARGNVDADGTYHLSTNKPGDGVPPGKYRVLINPMDMSDLPDEAK